jgi:hypothetical protein
MSFVHNWRKQMMNSKVQLLLVLAVGGALGYAAAGNKLNIFQGAEGGSVSA